MFQIMNMEVTHDNDYPVVSIDGGHLYRYPSEVDPRKKATKVLIRNIFLICSTLPQPISREGT